MCNIIKIFGFFHQITIKSIGHLSRAALLEGVMICRVIIQPRQLAADLPLDVLLDAAVDALVQGHALAD